MFLLSRLHRYTQSQTIEPNILDVFLPPLISLSFSLSGSWILTSPYSFLNSRDIGTANIPSLSLIRGIIRGK